MKSYKDVNGTGADRYKIAYEQIQSNFDRFDVKSGLEALKKTWQTSGYPTQCSMIFDPVKYKTINVYSPIPKSANSLQ